MKDMYSRDFSVTAVSFDTRGQSYPRRILFRGQTIWLDPPQAGYIPCHIDTMYYWLVRRGRTWQLWQV